MEKIAFSDKYRGRCPKDEFYARIEPLLQNEQVLRLDLFAQHLKYSRLRHSMDVAYISYRIARFLRWDCDSVARAALLHDFFFHADGQGSLSLVRSHPAIALENARGVCELNKIEEDIILKHMWLLTMAPPRYKEGYIVTFVDKYCALREFAMSLFMRRQKHAVLAGKA